MTTLQEKKEIIAKERTGLKTVKDQKVKEVNQINQRMIELEWQNKLLTDMIKEQTPLTPTWEAWQTNPEWQNENLKKGKEVDAQK